MMKKRRIWIAVTVLFLAACKNFDGVVGDTGESYTHTYNYPSSRIAPYHDPLLDLPEDPEEVDLCTGTLDSLQGFSCEQ